MHKASLSLINGLYGRPFLLLISHLLFSNIYGQINMEDSTAQVITYWNIGERQHYLMSQQNIQIKDSDTISNELITYEVDITVLDSTENRYTVEWFYRNFQSNSTNPFSQKMARLAEDVKVVIELNELGVFQGVKNWEEIRDYMHGLLNPLLEDFKEMPQFVDVINQWMSLYSSKEAIEASAILDILQFHNFHGAMYKLGKVFEFSLQVANLYEPSHPFDAEGIVYLDELNAEDYNFIIRSEQEINSEQLTSTTYNYLVQMAKTLGTTAPEKSEIGPLTNVTAMASRLHETGWVIYSVETKTVTDGSTTAIQERIMEIE